MARTADLEAGDTIWMGTADGLWLVQVFITSEQVTGWLSGRDDENRRRRAWRVVLGVVTEVELVPPTEATLKDKDDG